MLTLHLMAGLVSAIHVLLCHQDMDARHKAGHDEGNAAEPEQPFTLIAKEAARDAGRPCHDSSVTE
jgi:hypothetical protein